MDRDAWDVRGVGRDVGARVSSWCVGDELALASVVLLGNDGRFDGGREDARTVVERVQRRREWERDVGGTGI
jgi:hypothetical protein